MRDFVVLLFMMASIPLAMSNANIAFFLWTWAGLVAINSYVYGFMRSVPMVMVFAVVTLVLVALGRTAGTQKFQLNRTSILLIVFLLHGLVSAVFAFDGLPRNWELFSNMFKTVLLCLFMPMFLSDRNKINLFVILLVVSVSFHGMLDGLKFIASGGGHKAQGLLKFGDNNHYALVLLMVLPFLVYVYRYAETRLVRWSAMGVFLLTFLAMIATHSRGALVTTVAIIVWMILVGKKKIAGLVMAATLVFLVFQVAPSNWFERMDTIGRADEDASFMGRVAAWKRASAIALEHPVLGGGFHAGQGGGEIFERFRYKQGLLGFVETPNLTYAAAAHSIYFEVMGDLGFVGLFLFLLCILNVFYCRLEIIKMVKIRGPSCGWAEDLANFTSAGMVAFIVAGALLSAAYFEFPYYLMMLMQVIKLAIAKQTVPASA